MASLTFVVVGSVFAWILGLGVLFLTIYTTSRSTADSTAGVSVLFGSIFGLSHSDAVVAAAIGAAVAVVTVLIARPLLFASLDPAVASARRVPVAVLGLGFLALVGACAAEATQAVGAMLLLGLLAAPAGTALQLSVRPYRALALSCAVAVGDMWGGLTLSYVFPHLPPSFCVIAVAAGVYSCLLGATRARRLRAAPA